MYTRRSVVAGLCAAALVEPLVGCPAVEPWRRQAETALGRAAAFLWGAQATSGGWPSATYGLLASGQSCSAFVLLSLLEVPASVSAFPADKGSLALSFLLGRVDACGAVGFASDPPDYPMYATAMTASSLARTAAPGWESAAQPLVAWLRAQQCGDGFAGRAHEGGFPMGSKLPPTPDAALHVDLSMSRRALEALVACGAVPDDDAIRRGRAFVARSQTPAGGFLYSVAEDALNKGVAEAGRPGGYGSATTDGVLGLLACGTTLDDPAVVRALDWLVREHRLDANPGVSGGPWDAFAVAMRNYYRAGAATVFRRVGKGPVGWQADLVAAIVGEQRDDGSLASSDTLQKEDDPLIATGFAVQALSHALAA